MKQKLLKSSTFLNGTHFDLYSEQKSYVLNPLISWVKNLFIANNMQDKNKKRVIAQENAYTKNLLDSVYSMNYQLKLFKHIAFHSDKNRIVFSQGYHFVTSDLEGAKLLPLKIPLDISFPLDDSRDEIIPSPDCKYIAYTDNTNAICIQKISSNEVIQLTPNQGDYNTNALTFNHNSSQLAALSKKTIIIWNIHEPTKPA